MPIITGSRLKAERAGIHLKELEDLAGAFVNEHSKPPSRQLNPQNVDNFIYEFAPDIPPPLTFAVIVGDIAHNLRSALDHIAWQLALLTTQEPYEKTAFPIFVDTSERTRREFNRLTQSLPPETLRIIEAVQPYHRGDAAKYDPSNPTSSNFVPGDREGSNAMTEAPAKPAEGSR